MSQKLEIQKCDITTLALDCIVNAANSQLMQGGGVCGAIFSKAGPEKLQRACSMFGSCPTGSAILTPGFDLDARYIAHAVGPQWADGHHSEAQKLYRCYQTALTLATEKDCHSIAFPLISSGIYGYPKEEAWDVAIHSITDFLSAHPSYDLQVIMAVLDDEMLQLGNNILKKYVKSPESTHVNVCDMASSGIVEGFYILQSTARRTTAAGKPFLSASVTDKTGSIPVILWDYAGTISSLDDGKIVQIRGRLSEFKGAVQINLDSIRIAEPSEEIPLSCLVPVAPIDTEEMYRCIEELVDSIEDPDYRAICRESLRIHKDLLSIPAAKSVHHGFLYGLLMHTGNMLKTADFLASLYPEVINRSLLLTGTLLHDFAKGEEFTFSSLGLVTDYSVKGQLLGHLVMGAQQVAETAKTLGVPEEKSLLLQHMLLSHHGKPEYGAAVVPLCAESELLSLIDMMDSRMEIYRETLQQTPVGKFSDRVFPLDGHRIFHHYDPKKD